MGSFTLLSIQYLRAMLKLFAAVLSASALDWLNLRATPADRAKALCANLTIDEKISLLHGTGWGHDKYVGVAKGVPGKVPDLNLNDGPQGFRCNGLGKCPGGTSTQFPSGLTVAATWDANATENWGIAMGKEFYAKGANVQLGPGMCIARVPRNGRNFEYMSGEDPFLGYTLVQGAVKGIQSQSVIANAKHYILNNQETERNSISADIDERTLYEMYIPPFEGAVEANVGSFMCSYNRINGHYSCESNATLNTALRDHLGYKGWVMSDWRATHSTSILDGLDQQMPGDNYMGSALKDTKYKDAVDTSVIRILTPMFELGIMDKANNNPIEANASTAESMVVARQLSEQSTVLVQNKNALLPLDEKTVRKIVLVGGNALNPVTGGGGSGLVNPSYLPSPFASIAARFPGSTPSPGPSPAVGNNCSEAHWEADTDYFNGEGLGHAHGTGAADCCQQCANKEGCVYFSFKESGTMGSTCWFKTSASGRKHDTNVISGRCRPAATPPPSPSPPLPTPSSVQVLHANDGKTAAAMAQGADACIVFVATTSHEGGDRDTLGYGSSQDSMVTDTAAACANTVVVAVSPWAPKVSSILMPFMPGQMFGDALTNLLFGDVAPSGKLPLTMPNKDNEQKFSKSQWPGESGQAHYSEGLFVGYRWYDKHAVAPLFPFGHGLSYSNFDFDGLTASATSVTFTLKNNGTRTSSEVPQLYLAYPESAGEPPRVLRGFEKVALAAGASQSVTFTLRDRDFSVWNNQTHGWTKVSGEFGVFVGASSRDIRLHGKIQI